jgi:hypothetical protein
MTSAEDSKDILVRYHSCIYYVDGIIYMENSRRWGRWEFHEDTLYVDFTETAECPRGWLNVSRIDNHEAELLQRAIIDRNIEDLLLTEGS